MNKDKVRGDGQELNGHNRRNGVRDRCHECVSEYHLAPRGPFREVPRSEPVPGSPGTRKVHRLSYSAISMETPAKVQSLWRAAKDEGSAAREQTSATTLDLGGQFSFKGASGLVVLDTGAAANLAGFRWLERRNRIFGFDLSGSRAR